MRIFDKFKKEDKFPFIDGKDKVTFTCRHIMSKQKCIDYVSHDLNGDWTFLCSECRKKLDLNSAMVVALVDLYKIEDISKYNNLQNNYQCEYDNISLKSNDEYEEWLTNIKEKIIETNISRNSQLRSDFSGIKIKR